MSHFILRDTTTSTMQEARRIVDQQIAAGKNIIVASSHQTKGQGRQGRSWTTAPGNLAMTICLPLNQQAILDPKMAFVAGLAVHQTLCALLNADIKIKWPNDVLIEGKKVCGILLERYQSHMLIGIGVNIVTHPDGLAATHLAAYHVDIAYETLAKVIYKNVVHFRNILQNEGFAPLREQWLAHAAFLGEEIFTHHPVTADKISGIFTGVDLQGSIVLECAPNKIMKVHAGDIFPALR